MRRRLQAIKAFFSTRTTTLLWVLAISCFLLSFLQVSHTNVEARADKVEKRLHKREQILQSFVDKAFQTPANEWIRFDNLPEDMVIYRYVDNRLQSWVNTFPISNDDLRYATTWYRINDLRYQNLSNIPLAFLTDSVQFVNLGPKWYVIKIFDKDNIHIIAGIEVMEKYSAENDILRNTFNSKLGLSDKYLALPPYVDDISIVHTSDGTPSFSVIKNVPLGDNSDLTWLRWVALLLGISAIMSYCHRNKGIIVTTFSLVGIAVLQLCAIPMMEAFHSNTRLFSPMLFADTNFGSLGSLLIFHTFVFLYCAILLLSRKTIIKNIRTSGPVSRRIKLLVLAIAAVALATYIHMTFKSLILNSVINLDLYRINEISFYSILVFFMYSLLGLALLTILSLLGANLSKNFIRKRKRHSKRMALLYILLTSAYMVGAVNFYSFQKECETLRILTGRMAVERDLHLEMQLQALERNIITDPLIRRMAGLPEYESIILNRLSERYFFNIVQNYEIRLTICNANSRIKTGEYTPATACMEHYRNIIDTYGLQLSNTSAFYYLDYFRNTTSYIGAFSIFRNGVRYDMYIEIESRSSEDNTGYPSILTDSKSSTSFLKHPYSMARYHQGRITSHQGRYNFPVTASTYSYDDGFSHFSSDGYIIFINKLHGSNMIAVSRPERGVFSFLISFSYLTLFSMLIIIGIPLSLKKKHKEAIFRPKWSVRSKMTIFLTISMVIALLTMAIGSVIIILRYIDNDKTTLMERKLMTVSNTLSEIAQNAGVSNRYNTAEMLTAIREIAKNNQIDINLFDSTGRLTGSTRAEIFNEYLSGTRIDHDAFYELVYNRKMQFIQAEHISALEYSSLYAPIYNSTGELIYIANIPYFTYDTNSEYDVTPVIAAIINLYLILIIVVTLTGVAISNSITRPLKEISRNMQAMDITHKVAHINYKANDELGLLVKTYNKMIDDLDQSTKELAQSEREQAWREMARQIAHEIKNPLTPMKLSIQHLIRLKKSGVPGWQDRFEALASSLIEQIDILSNTANEFSSFAKFYNEAVTEVNLSDILSEQIILFDNRENIDIELRSAIDRAVINARKDQITRAFVNLISNAVQAVEGSDHGKIIISLRAQDNNYRVDIEDNGPGVAEENKEKLFSPNFTTKTKGTGLGLAICKSIISQSHGQISYCESRELGGADFVVLLPSITNTASDLT